MKKILLAILLVPALNFAHDHGDEYEKHFRFVIQEKKYRFSDEFELEKEEMPFGIIKKSKVKFPGRTKYFVHDEQGHLEAVGITQFFRSILATSLSDIYVYDEKWEFIGAVSGHCCSTKYSFYNQKGDEVAVTYGDKSGAGFSLLHPENEDYILGRFKRKFVQDTIDPWEVNVYVPDAVDIRLLKVFAAFVVDRQGDFCPDK